MKQFTVFLIFALSLTSPLAADGDSGSGETIITDEEELFGETVLEDMTEEAEQTDIETLLSRETVDIGGKIAIATSTAADFTDFWGAGTDLDLEADVYLDARPDEDFRVFLKAGLSYPFLSDDDREFSDIFTIKEIFSDFQIGDSVFFRAGKHTVTWGVGYFFSPADIINLEMIDPEDPEADRTGPVSLKTQVPFGSHNGYLYLLLDEWAESSAPAIAPKLEFVIGGAEVGIGGYYHYEAPPAGMLTFSFPYRDFSFFGELMGRYGSDKTFVEESDDLLNYPLGYAPVLYEDTFFFSGTAGVIYSHMDDDNRFNFTLAGQYYYNGEGYADPSVITDNTDALGYLAAAGELTVNDLLYPGQHYGAALVSWAGMLDSDFSTSLFWMGSFSDMSGRITASISYRVNDYFSLSLGLLQTYGAEGLEFTPDGRATKLTFEASLGTGKF